MHVSLTHATAGPLWHDLTLEVKPGEFIAILGPNGVGKSTLVRVLLGQQHLTGGSCTCEARVGYIPQQQMFPRDLPLRGKDLVNLSTKRGQADTYLAQVGASHLANLRVGTMSGGQQQLIRQAQAFAQEPELILADEPLLSLDAEAQRASVDRLVSHPAAIVMVTHAVAPIIDHVDRILYIGPHGHALGTPAEVLTSDTLTRLNGHRVDVTTIGGRLVIA